LTISIAFFLLTPRKFAEAVRRLLQGSTFEISIQAGGGTALIDGRTAKEQMIADAIERPGAVLKFCP